jgi:hypothetical protein
MADKVWKDRIAPRKKDSGKYPFDFKAPSYDNRTSCSISAGNDYGTGFNQRVGTRTGSGLGSGANPVPGRVHTKPSKGFIEKYDIQG